MESATIFLRMMKKLLHLVSIPISILKGHLEDPDILSIDRQYVLQALKLRSDYYRSDEVKALYQEFQDRPWFASLFVWFPISNHIYLQSDLLIQLLRNRWTINIIPHINLPSAKTYRSVVSHHTLFLQLQVLQIRRMNWFLHGLVVGVIARSLAH